MNANAHSDGAIVGPGEDDGPAGTEFLNLFCEKFGCRQGKFESRFLLECVYPEGRDLSRLINAIRPRYFRSEYALIEEIKHTTSFSEFKKLVDYYGAQQNQSGLFRTLLKARLSKSRLLHVAHSLFGNEK